MIVGPNGIRSGWRFLTFVVIFGICSGVLLLVVVAAGLLHLAAGKLVIPFTARNGLLSEAITVLALFVAAFFMSKIERRRMGEYGLPFAEAFGVRFWQGVIWGIVAVTLTMFLIAALHGFTFGAIALSGDSLFKYAVAWALVFLLTGFGEEFLFRGYSQFTLTHGMKFWPAAIFLSALFGASHLSNNGEAWPGALSAGLIGFFFCFTLRRTGSIWFAVGLHAAWDYGETFVYGVPDSGFVAPGHLFNSNFHGPRWLTGGSVGPEASVVCFAVLALMFIVFHFAFPTREEGALGS